MGLPYWVLSNTSNEGLQVIDWNVNPPQAVTLAGTGPTVRTCATPAINNCGEIVFFAVHSGIRNSPTDLFIIDPEGNTLLDDGTPNGPGLNAKLSSIEFQVTRVPGKPNEWYIIYPQWKTDNGAPLGDGAYVPAPALYSRVKYSCGIIEVLERDVPLTVNNIAYTYTNGMAIKEIPGENSYYIYLARRSEASSSVSLDRFRLSSSGIYFDQNTGDIYAPYWNLTIDCSEIEVSNDGKRILFNNRHQNNGWLNFLLFDADLFNNSSAGCQRIYLGDLILQPDNQVLFSAAAVDEIEITNSNLYFLQNLERKISDITFSPDGKYIYFVNGGFVAGYYTNITYLGQVEIGPVSNPAPYPYNLRLQIQSPPEGIYDPYSGQGGLESAYTGMVPSMLYIAGAFDGHLYFVKRDIKSLFVIPEPDSPMPQMLIPGDIDLATSAAPNIPVNGILFRPPDQIDGYDYMTNANPGVSLGNDTIICEGSSLPLSPGSGYSFYCWQDGSTGPVYYASGAGTYWVEVTDEFGCFGRDTIEISTTIASTFLGNDISICERDSVIISPGPGYVSYLWQDGSTDMECIARTAGNYWVEVGVPGGCLARDTVNVSLYPAPVVDLGPDQVICQGNEVILDAGEGFSQYHWQDGSTGRYLAITQEGPCCVEVSNLFGCKNRDTVHIIAVPGPIVDLGPDLVLEPGQSAQLDAGPGFESYLWQDGSIGQYIEVSEEGIYWVTVSNGYCLATDSILVNRKDCTARLYIPNCFTPNGDGYNEEFRVVAENLESFEMMIFNRWGQMLFETSDIRMGWNGKVNGSLSPQGTYFYLVRFSTRCIFGLEDSGTRKGTVTLIE